MVQLLGMQEVGEVFSRHGGGGRVGGRERHTCTRLLRCTILHSLLHDNVLREGGKGTKE